MPKAYWVVTYRSVKSPEAWQAYAKLAVPAIESAGGRFLARSNPARIYEAGMNERVVLVEFDSVDKGSPATTRPPTRKRSRRSVLAMLSGICVWSRASLSALTTPQTDSAHARPPPGAARRQ
jgi:uncharacterized protein (DUF1330 family)